MSEEERNNEISSLNIPKIIGDVVYMSNATDIHGQGASHILGTFGE